MADNVDITPGSGKTIATDERSIGGSTVQVQRVNEQGSTSIATGRATVTTTSASAVAARETRKRVVLYAPPANTADIDIGPSGVASGSGFGMAPGSSLTLYTTAAIHADAASGSQTLAYVEEYD